VRARSFVAVVVLVAMMSGCNTKAGAVTGLTLGTLGVMAGATVYASPSDPTTGDRGPHFLGGAFIFVGAFVMLCSALELVALRTHSSTTQPAP